MKYNKFNLSWLFLISFLHPFILSAQQNADTVRAEDFGILPDSRQNTVPALQKALEVCRTKAHPVLVFSSGRYDFWPQYSVEKVYYESNTTAVNPKRCPIWINDFTELIIDGQGSDFIYHDRMQPFTIDNSSNILIKNISIDWDIPFTAQAVVADTTTGYVDLRIDEHSYPFVIENGKLVFTGEGWKSEWWASMEFEKDSRLIVPRTGDEGVFGDKWEEYRASLTGNGLVRLQYGFTRKPAPGNVLVMRHSERDHSGIFITDSKNVQLENINIYQTAGLGILAQYTEDLTFRNIHVVPNAKKGRYFSGHDDGCHFSNCKGQILIEDSEFSGLMDDPINVHGTAVQIIGKRSPTELVCRFMHSQSLGMKWARIGDTVAFIRHESMQTTSSGYVVGFNPIDTQDFILQFRDSVPDNILVKDALENLSWTPSFTVRRSNFGVNRARGLLISTPGKVIVENNIFESSGSAILIAGDANQWFESGAVKDVVIRNNKFLDACLTSMYQFCEAIISIEPEIPKMDPKNPFHRNIIITGNEFHPYDYPVLYAKSVDGLEFSGNSIARSKRFAPFHPSRYMLSFVACRKVSVSGNQLTGDVLGKNIRLSQMSQRELSLKPASGITISRQ